MHSKVIIASLVCMLAASFGGNRTANHAEVMQPKAEEVASCAAPNDGLIDVALYADTPYQGNDFCAFIRGIEYQSGLENALTVISNPNNLSTAIGYHPAYGHYFNVAQPTSDGDYYATMGAYGKGIATIYIFRKNGVCYGSVYSKNDARDKYYAATNPSIYQTATHFQASSSGFTAVKDYTNLVYGSDDISTGMNVSSRPSGEANTGTTIKITVKWQAGNKTYPATNIPVHLAIRGAEYTPSVEKKTNSSGVYSVTLGTSVTSGLTLNNFGFGLYPSTAVTEVQNSRGMNYPYYAKYNLSWSVSSYKAINFTVTIYPDRSDRAAAYEITQAHQLLVSYARDYTKRTPAKIITEYPAGKTAYYPNEQKIAVRKAHYNSWDVLNHEYAHYICDDANLCHMPTDYENQPHRYNEDLSYDLSEAAAARLAYCEGLANFIVITGQVKNAVYSSNAYINTIADYCYTDSINGVYVDYSLNKYGEPNSAHGSTVEASITNVMLRLMTECYWVGEGTIWNAIINAGGNSATISRFATELVALCPREATNIYNILESENITDCYESLDGINSRGAWTLMLYFCGSSNLVDQAAEELQSILEVAGQPSNVNILVYYGGSKGWLQYAQCDFPINGYVGFYGHIRDNEFIKEANTGDNMGDPNTLAEFINWGIEEYPANRMGLVLFNHGRALDGVCFDSTHYDDCLTNSEVAQAMETVYSDHPNMEGKFEFIGYDACLMQLQDVADFNSDYFNYMVASEEYTYGWDWTGFIEDIYDYRSTITALTTLCDDFIQKNDEIFMRQDGCHKACLSVLDLSKVKKYRAKFEIMAESIKTVVANHYNEFVNIICQSRQYANRNGGEQKFDFYGTIDGYDFLTGLASCSVFSQYASQIYAARSAYLQTIVVNRKANSLDPSRGLAIHVCLDGSEQTYDADQTHFYNWRSLFC